MFKNIMHAKMEFAVKPTKCVKRLWSIPTQ